MQSWWVYIEKSYVWNLVDDERVTRECLAPYPLLMQNLHMHVGTRSNQQRWLTNHYSRWLLMAMISYTGLIIGSIIIVVLLAFASPTRLSKCHWPFHYSHYSM